MYSFLTRIYIFFFFLSECYPKYLKQNIVKNSCFYNYFTVIQRSYNQYQRKQLGNNKKQQTNKILCVDSGDSSFYFYVFLKNLDRSS